MLGCRRKLRQLHPLVRRRRASRVRTELWPDVLLRLATFTDSGTAVLLHCHDGPERSMDAQQAGLASLSSAESFGPVPPTAARDDRSSSAPLRRAVWPHRVSLAKQELEPLIPLLNSLASACGQATTSVLRPAVAPVILGASRRTPGISCEAVPASILATAGMRRHLNESHASLP